MKIENLKDLLKLENYCIHLKELLKMYRTLNNKDFINKNEQEQIDYINKYKDKLNLCDQLLQRGELLDDQYEIEFLKEELADKQMKLNLYSTINNNPELFSNPITLIDNLEFEKNITEGEKSIHDFRYIPPNSSSNSAIFKGYYKGKKCYFKTFTVSNSKRLEYEQRIYKYIQNRNEQLRGALQDNFVDIIDVFKIKENDFKEFFDKLNIYRWFPRDPNNKFKLEFKNLFNNSLLLSGVYGPYDIASYYIYFIVTGDIEGVPLFEHIKNMLESEPRNARGFIVNKFIK